MPLAVGCQLPYTDTHMIALLLLLAAFQVNPSGVFVKSPDGTWTRTMNTDPAAVNDDDVRSGSGWHTHSHAHAKRDHSNHSTHVVDSNTGGDMKTAVSAANAGGESWAKTQSPEGRRVEGITLTCSASLSFETEGTIGDPEAFGATGVRASYASSTTSAIEAKVALNAGTETDSGWDAFLEDLLDGLGIPVPTFQTSGWGVSVDDSDANGHNRTSYGMVFDMTLTARSSGASAADGNIFSGDVTSNGESASAISGNVILTGDSQ